MSMLNKLFGKPKQESNALATLDKLNEVSSSIMVDLFFIFQFCLLGIKPLIWLIMSN